MEYEEPAWSGCSSMKGYGIEVVKNGVIVENLSLDGRAFHLFGRDDSVCHVHVPHPSVSRVHAVLQKNKNGMLFLMDLDSTHGTFWNKQRLKKRLFCRVTSGDFIRFGGSTRDYIVSCPSVLESQQSASYCESGCNWGQNEEVEEIEKEVEDDKNDSDDEIQSERKRCRRENVGGKEIIDDDDDDEMIDDVGDVETRKEKSSVVVETAASLCRKIEKSWEKIQEFKRRLIEMNGRRFSQDGTETDALDAFMAEIQEKTRTEEQRMIEHQIVEEEHSVDRAKSLLKLADPSALRRLEKPIKPNVSPTEELSDDEKIDGKVGEKVEAKKERRLTTMEKVDRTEEKEEKGGAGEEIQRKQDKMTLDPERTHSKEPRHSHNRMKKRKVVETYHTVEWTPPPGQKGDGRSEKIKRLGY